MKVIVCGGRNFKDYTLLSRELDQLAITHIVSGGATGADRLAEVYAQDRVIPLSVYKADWDTYGRRAGPLRNRQMLDSNPDVALVIGFEGGVGTANMLDYAKSKKVKTTHIIGEQ